MRGCLLQVYSALFDDLVRRINASVGGQRGGQRIGVLDIFGFEIFEQNSFEQLCINFTNERLQGLFNEHTFQQEENLYLEEGIPHEKVAFIDNKPVVEVLSLKPCDPTHQPRARAPAPPPRRAF